MNLPLSPTFQGTFDSSLSSSALNVVQRPTPFDQPFNSSYSSSAGTNRAIAFIDSSLNDYEVLVSALQPGTEVVILNSAQSGLQQVQNYLAGQSHIASLQIFSHGESGSFQLGSDLITANNANLLQSWASSLTEDADILLYGCNVAQGELGQAFIQILSQLTGADIAASNNLTGSANLDGDWILEYQVGEIEAILSSGSSILSHYNSLLPIVNGSFETGDYTGWTLFESSGIPNFGTWGIATNGQVIANSNSTFDFFDGINVTQFVANSPFTYTATDGNFLAYQLQNGPEIHRMYQDIAIPVGITTLNWDMEYRNLAGGFNAANQSLTVSIRDLSNNLLQTLFTTGTESAQTIPMTRFSGDISAFAGSTVRLDVTLNVNFNPLNASFDNFAFANVAPVLNTSGNPTLPTLPNSTTNPTGITVGQLITQLGGSGITDPNTGALRGIAITAVDNSNGRWQYSTDGGTTWVDFGSVSGASARLLADAPNNQIRFVPNAGFSGTVTGGISFRAWDQTSGTNGSTANTSVNGGASAFSMNIETADITIAAPPPVVIVPPEVVIVPPAVVIVPPAEVVVITTAPPSIFKTSKKGKSGIKIKVKKQKFKRKKR